MERLLGTDSNERVRISVIWIVYVWRRPVVLATITDVIPNPLTVRCRVSKIPESSVSVAGSVGYSIRSLDLKHVGQANFTAVDCNSVITRLKGEINFANEIVLSVNSQTVGREEKGEKVVHQSDVWLRRWKIQHYVWL